MNFTRRDFLKLSCLSAAGLAFLPGRDPPLPDEPSLLDMFGRITRNNEPVYSQPDPRSHRVDRLARDTIVRLLEEVQSNTATPANPRWYHLERGFLHSANVQRVHSYLNQPLASIPEAGVLGQVTVPYTQVEYKTRSGHWMPLYWLYYSSLHWITGLQESSSGEKLYNLTNERLKISYRVPARHLRPLAPEEYSPLPDNTTSPNKRLEVSLEKQTVTAFEGDRAVREFIVSTGRRFTPTYTGLYQVDRKYPSRHMGDGGLTSNIQAYELVGVPWVSFFQPGGVAFHGAFWHDNFGVPTSNGCVNMRTQDALWLFRWTAPPYTSQSTDRPTWKTEARVGTVVLVR
jgi:lipoprotein-anchoring transpeptidase ErfK/SrfK